MLICADLHIGKISDSIIIGGVYSQITDTQTVLNEVRLVAVKTGQTIVVAGDVFNTTNPPTWVIAVWFGFLADCKKSGVHVVQIPGNHDAGVDWVNLSMVEKADLDNVTIIKKICQVEIDGQLVTFLPHLPLREQELIINEYGSIGNFVTHLYPDAEFILGHGQIRGIQYSNDIFFEAGDALDINAEDFPVCKLMVLGHVHKYMIYDWPNGGKTVYPGSMTITNFGEVDDVKGYLEVRADLSTEFHIFNSDVTPYQYVVIDLVTKDDVNLDEAVIKDIAFGAVIKIVVTTNDLIKVNESEIRKVFNKWGYVSRFETILESVDGEVDYSEEKSNLTDAELLEEYLDSLGTDISKKVRALVMAKGKWVIQEVMNAL